MAVGKPIIAVAHATSKQSTSVVISLLQTDKFVVKAITRDASSVNAKQLAAKGALMIEADASDEGQLRAAFEGAYGVFAMTGKYSLPHFSSKAHVMDYVEEKHRDMIGIYPAVACFYTNLIEYMPPRPGPDGVLTFAMPIRGDYPIQWLNPYTALGPVVTAAFTEPDKYRSMVIPVYDEVLTCEKLVQTFTDVTGIKARYHELTREDMIGVGLPEPVVDMQLEMYKCSIEFGFYSPDRDLDLVHKINPHPETWADFLKTTGYDGTQKLDQIRHHYVQ